MDVFVNAIGPFIDNPLSVNYFKRMSFNGDELCTTCTAKNMHYHFSDFS